MIYRALCINSGGCTELQNYEEYYVYDAGEKNFYVSIFPTADKSYFGSYSKDLFKVLEKCKDKDTVKKQNSAPAEEDYQQITLF